MPNRIIREGILTSDKVDQLDPPAEVFYRRLLSKVDDYGRYDARLSVLRASLFPLRIDRVREADCSRWIAACEKAGLIALYHHDGKPYLEVANTGWTARSASKFPDPRTLADNCAQLKTSARLDVDVGVVVVDEEQGAPPAAVPAPEAEAKSRNGKRLPDNWTLPSEWADWARTKRPDLNIAEQGEKFADHFRAAPGVKGRKTDWEATWRNWIRNERRGTNMPPPSAVQSGKPQGPSETPLERAVAWARQQHALGAIDEIERDRLIAAATEKHRRAA